MIGYYVHHHGRGHLHRALAVAAELDEPVTFLSSLPEPDACPGRWVQLERDDEGPPPVDPRAGERLHWVPLGDPGLRRRMGRIAQWIDQTAPRLLVADVSVEVALLARLHGVPVVTVVLPGRRADAAHRLGFDVSSALVGMWPDSMSGAMLPGLPDDVRRRVRGLGALSRYPVEDHRRRPVIGGGRRVALLAGTGGSELTPEIAAAAAASTPGWEWTVLGLGHWHDDPRAVLRSADVVVTHAGQNALAEVAALRRPAVVVPQERPHDEQAVTGAALCRGGWPVVVEDRFPVDGWPALLARTAGLDGQAWRGWCDGEAARRFAALLADPPVAWSVA